MINSTVFDCTLDFINSVVEDLEFRVCCSLTQKI